MKRWSRHGLLVLGAAALGLADGTASGQVRLDNLSVTMGLRGEVYSGDGNFLAIAVPQIDSTEGALAAAGEMVATGTFILMARNGRSLSTDFDFSMRQFYTGGFQLRNYAPRQLSGSVEANYRQRLGGGWLLIVPTFDSRHIADRPPMPLYLPPAYVAGAVGATYSKSIAADLGLYGQLTGEIKDYAAPENLPAVDDLGRRSVSLEAGVQRVLRGPPETRNPEISDRSAVRFFAAYLHHNYPKQGLGLLRRDHAVRLGGEFTMDRRDTQGFFFELLVTGTRSRSNSRRVDHNVGRIQATGSVELGDDTQLELRGLWAVKRYIHEHVWLVPGEEADNATSVFAEVTRFLRDGMRAGIGGGWTRAETNISGAYYQRFSVSFNLTINPGF